MRYFRQRIVNCYTSFPYKSILHNMYLKENVCCQTNGKNEKERKKTESEPSASDLNVGPDGWNVNSCIL